MSGPSCIVGVAKQSNSRAASVVENDYVSRNGHDVNIVNNAVRPALNLNLASPICRPPARSPATGPSWSR